MVVNRQVGGGVEVLKCLFGEKMCSVYAYCTVFCRRKLHLNRYLILYTYNFFLDVSKSRVKLLLPLLFVTLIPPKTFVEEERVARKK